MHDYPESAPHPGPLPAGEGEAIKQKEYLIFHLSSFILIFNSSWNRNRCGA
jgi:hypothetical protein